MAIQTDYCLCFARLIAASGKALLAMTLLAWSMTPAPAHAFTLAWPVDCTLGQNCFIQNFVDHDPSTGVADFTCGTASYDGHDGTDIRLASLAAMRAGVAVKAAADGVVEGTRSNVVEASIREANAPNVAGRECGNGVRIRHADGYATQYCHMRRGAITAQTGQAVKAADVLGYIGLSGQTEFPHLHLSVWKDGKKIDPFTGGDMQAACSASTANHSLWAAPVAYQPTALLGHGFVSEPPTPAAMRDTPATLSSMAANAPALIYWVDVMNLRQGDILSVTITGPDGGVFAQRSTPFDKAKAVYFGFVGKKNARGHFASGTYVATMAVMRGGKNIVTKKESIDVR